jgi:DNA excision repair protein ERCC-4
VKREVPPLQIAQDTREPSAEHDGPEALFAPFLFAPAKRGTPLSERAKVRVPLVRAKLDAGDYSLPGLESVVAIERKTLPDLLGTLFGSRTDSVGDRAAALDRFRAELLRSQTLAAFSIVVEASVGDLFAAAASNFERAGASFDPAAVLCLLDAFAIDYRTETVWAGSREAAEHRVAFRLARVWSQHHGGEDWTAAEKRGIAPALRWGFGQRGAAGEAAP